MRLFKNVRTYNKTLRVLCLSSCLSSVCYCGTLLQDLLFYRLGNNNQTDQGDEIEGLEREVLKDEGLERVRMVMEGVKELYFVEAQPMKHVGSQCHLQLHY